MLLCQHEKIAVQIAHGYAKATGKPMVAIVHDVVGLLHATMGIYYAYIDRAPIFVIGATGPMDESRRRPFIDWIHTANVQGEQVRHYVKWDYQPGSIEGVPDCFARAYGGDDDRAAGPDLHVLRRLAAGAAAHRRDRAADRRRRQGAGADGGRPDGARRGRRPPAGGANSRCCSPNMSDARRTASTISWRSPRPSAPRSTTSTAGSIFPTAIRST